MPARTTATITLKEGRTDLVMGVVFTRGVPRLVENPDLIEYLRHAGSFDVQIHPDPEEEEGNLDARRTEAERLAAEEAERLAKDRERFEAALRTEEEVARLATEAGQADLLPESEIPSIEGGEALDVDKSTDGGEVAEEDNPPAAEADPPVAEAEPKVEAGDSPAPEPVPVPASVKPKAPAKGGSKSKPKKKKPKPKPKAKK